MIKRSDIYLTTFLGLIFCFGLLYVALPRCVAAYVSLDGAWIADRLIAGGEPSTEELRKLAVSRGNALHWSDDPEYARHLALAYQELVERVSPENRKSLSQATYDATLRELGMRPMNGLAWWRLGKMDYNLAGGPTRKAAAYHLRSVQIAPNIMTMMSTRLKSIILNWFQFEPAGRRQVLYQFGAAWRRDRPSILDIADNPAHRGILRGAMASEPALLGEFESRLARENARAKP